MSHPSSPQTESQRQLDFLFQLSLHIGASLSAEENARQFLILLLKHWGLPYGAVWIRASYLPQTTTSEPHFHLLNAWPQSRAQTTRLPWPQTALAELPAYRPYLLSPDDPLYAGQLHEEIPAGAHLLFFGLDDLGFLKLVVPPDHEYLQPRVHAPLGMVLEKFTVSLKAVLSHQRRLTETEEKLEIQRQMRQQDRLYKTVLQSLEEGLVITDLEGRPTYANRRFEELTGYQYRDLRDRPLYQSITPESEWPRIEKHIQALRSEEVVRYTYPFVNARGEVLDVSIHMEPYYRDDRQLAGAVVALTDITELEKNRRAVQKQKDFYETILNSIPSDIVVFDDQHRYRFLNPVAVRDPELRAWLIGKDDFEYCRAKDKPLDLAQKRRALFHQALENENGLTFEEALKKPDGSTKHHLRHFFPVRDEAGKLKLMIGYGLDITDLKHTQQELEQAKEQAEALAQAKQQFLANMSHEIRTPLHAIQGMARWLEKEPLSENQRNYLQTLQSSGRQLLTIVNDVLDISKIEAGKVMLDPQPFALRPFLRQLLDTHRFAAEDKGVALKQMLDEDLSAVLVADTVRLGQVLGNLLSNAVKFTEQGKVQLSVTVEKEDTRQQRLRFEVRDTGLGIDPEKLSLIFGLFAQEYSNTSRKYGGTGLGLAISQGLVRLMGGELQVESEKNAGSRFFFSLDFEKSTPEALEGLLNHTESADADLSGRHILLAEDNPINRHLAEQVLKERQARVTAVENGREAVHACAQVHFDLVLMDIQMPEMGGIEATREIRKRLGLEVLPIVALTANAIKSDLRLYREAGMNDTLTKPYEPSELIGIVARHLKGAPAAVLPDEAPKPENPEPEAEKARPSPETAAADTLDFEHLWKMCNQDEGFYRQMVNLFVQENTAYLEEWHGSAEAEDWPAIGRLAHKMKSPIKMLKADELVELLKELEKAGDMEPGRRAVAVREAGARMQGVLDTLRTRHPDIFNS